MKTYVLVHGGGHGGWCYQPVARLLRAKGHEAYAVTLTGLGERSHLLNPDIDLETHITDVVNTLEFEDLRNVILVGHSYGGMVITGVADRVPERIGNLVYLDASYPRNGESLAERAGPLMREARTKARIVDGVELVLFPGDDPLGFYGVTDPAQIAWMKTKLTPHPWKCFDQKLVLGNEPAMRRLPQSFIMCSYRMNDQSRAEFTRIGEGRYWEIDTGHDLMISEPQATADALLQIDPGG
jgi:pimeloyl-ACP methyl ester carboxylesterase